MPLGYKVLCKVYPHLVWAGQKGILKNWLSHGWSLTSSLLLFQWGKPLWFLEAQWGPIGIVADQEGMSRLQESPSLGYCCC